MLLPSGVQICLAVSDNARLSGPSWIVLQRVYLFVVGHILVLLLIQILGHMAQRKDRTCLLIAVDFKRENWIVELS